MKYIYKCEFIGTPECEKCMLSDDDGVHRNCMALGSRPRCPGDGCRNDCPLQLAIQDEPIVMKKALGLACTELDERIECCPTVYYGGSQLPKCKTADCDTEWFRDCWREYFIQQAQAVQIGG